MRDRRSNHKDRETRRQVLTENRPYVTIPVRLTILKMYERVVYHLLMKDLKELRRWGPRRSRGRNPGGLKGCQIVGFSITDRVVPEEWGRGRDTNRKD